MSTENRKKLTFASKIQKQATKESITPYYTVFSRGVSLIKEEFGEKKGDKSSDNWQKQIVEAERRRMISVLQKKVFSLFPKKQPSPTGEGDYMQFCCTATAV